MQVCVCVYIYVSTLTCACIYSKRNERMQGRLRDDKTKQIQRKTPKRKYNEQKSRGRNRLYLFSFCEGKVFLKQPQTLLERERSLQTEWEIKRFRERTRQVKVSLYTILLSYPATRVCFCEGPVTPGHRPNSGPSVSVCGSSCCAVFHTVNTFLFRGDNISESGFQKMLRHDNTSLSIESHESSSFSFLNDEFRWPPPGGVESCFLSCRCRTYELAVCQL